MAIGSRKCGSLFLGRPEILQHKSRGFLKMANLSARLEGHRVENTKRSGKIFCAQFNYLPPDVHTKMQRVCGSERCEPETGSRASLRPRGFGPITSCSALSGPCRVFARLCWTLRKPHEDAEDLGYLPMGPREAGMGSTVRRGGGKARLRLSRPGTHIPAWCVVSHVH